MSIVKANPFPEVDFNNYTSFEKLTLPNGEVLYKIPGHPGYVVNPAASNASGKIVIRPNPTDAINDEQQAKDAAEKARKQAEYNNSPMGQLAPVVVGTGATYAGIKWAQPDVAKEAPKVIPQTTPTPTPAPQNSAQIAANAPAQSGVVAPPAMNINGVSPQYPGGANYPALPDGSTNTLPPGTEVQADGSIIDAETGATIGRVAQGALGAYQIYQGVQDFKDDKVGGVLGVASGGANVATALGYTQAAPYAAPLMAAKGGYDLYNSFQNGGEGVRTAGTELGAGIGTMILPGVGTAAGAAIGNLAGYGLDKLGLFHKTTRQVAQEHTGDLLKQNPDDANYQNYVSGMREQFNAAPPDPSKPFAGKYASWDEYKKAGLEASDLTGVYGNIKAFGSEWANLSQAQREAVTKGIIDANLYTSNKGEVEISDENKAKEIKDNVLKGFQVGAQTSAIQPVQRPTGSTIAQPIAPANIAAGAPPRSTTSSPGIGLNGLPIPVKKQPLVIRR